VAPAPARPADSNSNTDRTIPDSKQNKNEKPKQIMKINCLSCGFKVELDDTYEDYEGQISCYVCNAIMEISTEDGKIKSVKLARRVDRPVVEAK
jgi:hypothetical protein